LFKWKAAAVAAALGSSIPHPVRAETPPEMPLNLKATLGGGVIFFEDPIHGMSALRPAEEVGISWAPHGIRGELGLTLLMDETHVSLIRLDMRSYFYKGPIFSHYVALGIDLVPSKDVLGGGGLMFGFEWKVHKHVGIVWAMGTDAVVYLPASAPPIPLSPKLDHQPLAFGYVMPSATLAVQARF
jgi:hypothetical protein